MSSQPQNFPDKFIKGIWLRALADARTPELDEDLRAVGIDLSQPLLPTYPREVWFPALKATAKRLFPTDDAELALRKLGQKLIDGLEAAGVFKGPAFKMVRFMGPRRILKDIGPRITGLGLGVQQVVTEVGTRELEIQLNEAEGGQFVGGALERLVRLMGGASPHVDVGPCPMGSLLRVRWS